MKYVWGIHIYDSIMHLYWVIWSMYEVYKYIWGDGGSCWLTLTRVWEEQRRCPTSVRPDSPTLPRPPPLLYSHPPSTSFSIAQKPKSRWLCIFSHSPRILWHLYQSPSQQASKPSINSTPSFSKINLLCITRSALQPKYNLFWHL